MSGLGAFIGPPDGEIASLASDFDLYEFAGLAVLAHGSGLGSFATSVAGDAFAFNHSALGAPIGYDDAATLTGVMTFVDASPTTLGCTPGVYVTTPPNDTIATNVIAAALPLPAAAPMLPGALGLIGAAARRKG